MLRATDVAVLAIYSVAYSRWIAAKNKVAADGPLITVAPVCGASSEAPFAGGISEQQGSALLIDRCRWSEVSHASCSSKWIF
jgi:phage terminase small subunit